MVAYLGRYAGQPADVVLRMGVRQMALLAAATSRIIRQEHEPVKR